MPFEAQDKLARLLLGRIELAAGNVDCLEYT